MNIRIGIFIILCVGALGAIVGIRSLSSVRAPQIIDRCPGEVRPAFVKRAALITNTSGAWTVTHPEYFFHFSFPDIGWHFEENTIQDWEEPILMPQYLYAFLVTSGGSYADARMPYHVIQLRIYPAMCNSPAQWSRVLETQGWQQDVSDAYAPMRAQWTVLSRYAGGRRLHLLFVHVGVLHYEFTISDDMAVQSADLNLIREMVRTFTVSKGMHETAN
jgi:hypothetical protein